MKKYSLNISLLACLLLLLTACEDDILNKNPVDKFSETVVWSDIGLADAYLLSTYDASRLGFSQPMLTAITDESYFIHGGDGYNAFLKGNISPENPFPLQRGFPWWSDFFANIQDINSFLANIDKVVESYPDTEKEAIKAKVDIMKGEALFLRAYNYSRLALNYGGLPLSQEPFAVGEDFSSITRASFKETIDFIVEDINVAAELLLNNGEMIMGRATKGAALALKSRILLFAASDLTADGSVENQYVGYQSADRTALWSAARNAAKEVMDLVIYELADFGAPNQEAVSENYYEFFRVKDLLNPEIIWGKMYLNSVGSQNRMNQWNGSNGLNNWSGINPIQNLVDDYQMENGSYFFDHFIVDDQGIYHNISDTYQDDNIYHHRDPRFYGSILYDGAQWQERFANLADRDPIGVYDRRTRIIIENGIVVSELPGIDTRQGPVEDWNGGYSGYLMKKMLDDEVIGRQENNENVWIEFRYAEILLNYAEASLELGDVPEATKYVNMIRNRAAMPDFTGDVKDALHYERRVELAFEGQRWLDIRRWKILDEALLDALGINIVETTENGNVSTVWERTLVQERGPVTKKMYWVPIPTEEMNKAPQLTQNPGY